MENKQTQIYIIDSIISEENILYIKFNDYFYTSCQNITALERLEFFARIGIITIFAICQCKQHMSIVKKSKTIDGYVWFCCFWRKEKTCRYSLIFEGVKSSMTKFFRAMHYLCKNSLHNDTVHDLEKSKNTVCNWFKTIRCVMRDYLIEKPVNIGRIG